MSSLTTKVPLTPLDGLRALLDSFSDGDPAFPGKLSQALGHLRLQALPDAGGRFAKPTTPRGLRRALLANVAKFDWPEWVPWIHQGLGTEPDLGVFDEGCAALGTLGTREALAALKALAERRPDPGHQTILARELAQFQLQQPLAHYLSRLQEGQGNPRLAAQGAKLLAAHAGAAEVPALVEACQAEDELTQRLALRTLGSIPGDAADDALLDLAERTRLAILDYQQLTDQLNRLHTLPRTSTLPELVRCVAARFEAKAREAATELQQAVARGEEGDPAPALEALRQAARGPLEDFLMEALTLALEGKVARYASLLSEVAPAAESQLVRLNAQCDQVAEILAARSGAGSPGLDRLLPLFTRILRSRVGGEAFLNAFLRLLPLPGQEILDELLADADMVRRERALNALGAREDDALTPFFLKAMADPIVELGILATHHLGKLPSSLPVLMEMFRGGNLEQVRLAIGAFKENRTREAGAPLVEFLQGDGHDALLPDAADALAAIDYKAGAPVLLDLLHDGKPLNLQIALTLALRHLGTAEASLGLLAKAATLKQPQVLILALEGSLRAFPGFDQPLPQDQLADFLRLLDRCLDDREGEGQRLRAILATQDLYVFDQAAYERLKEQFSDFLFDMRTKDTWDRDSNDRVAAVVKDLGRRAEGLALLAQKEGTIRTQSQFLPPAGPKRLEGLQALRESLKDPDLILRPGIAREVADLVVAQLRTPATEWRETAFLCEIGGLTRQAGELTEPIREIYRRATGLGLKSAARGALLALGLAEADLDRHGPIHSILLLEPSRFFRKRLAGILAEHGGWRLSEAGDRREAEAALEGDPVDLLLTESKDGDGDLAAWLQDQWNLNRFRYALVSTANRDIEALAQAPWVVGTLYKPYSPEQVLQALAD